MGRLFQSIGKGPNGSSQLISGTDTLFVIDWENISHDQRKETTYNSVVYIVQPQKEDPNCTCVTIGVNSICYPGEVGTPTASLELFKIVFNSVLSQRGTRYDTFDI